MTENSKQTPIRAQDFSKREDDGSYTLTRRAIVDAQGAVIVDDVVSEEWRQRIVRAVNSHDDLDAMVRELLNVHEAHHNHPSHAWARRLLERAEGKAS